MGCGMRYPASLSESRLPQGGFAAGPHAWGHQRVSLWAVLLTFMVHVIRCVLADGIGIGSTAAAQVSTFCELRRALADESVVHVVLTDHLRFDPAAACSGAAAGADAEGDVAPAQAISSRSSSSEGDTVPCEAADGGVDKGEARHKRCNEEVTGDRRDGFETVRLPLHVRGARKSIRV